MLSPKSAWRLGGGRSQCQTRTRGNFILQNRTSGKVMLSAAPRQTSPRRSTMPFRRQSRQAYALTAARLSFMAHADDDDGETKQTLERRLQTNLFNEGLGETDDLEWRRHRRKVSPACPLPRSLRRLIGGAYNWPAKSQISHSKKPRLPKIRSYRPSAVSCSEMKSPINLRRMSAMISQNPVWR